ncbi:PAS domain S-box protein [Tabrizicola sp.]|uniref:PAS domain S-box protein n=1 Tax=Tabrizicola sp. TaxID=2005166 RepID=UPI003D2D22E5
MTKLDKTTSAPMSPCELLQSRRDGLAQAVEMMHRPDGLEVGLSAALQLCRTLLAADACALMRHTDAGGLTPALCALADSNCAVFSSDWTGAATWLQGSVNLPEIGHLPLPAALVTGGQRYHAILAEPIQHEAELPLMLVALSTKAKAFSPKDTRFLRALCDEIGHLLAPKTTAQIAQSGCAEQAFGPCLRPPQADAECCEISNCFKHIIDLTNSILSQPGEDVDELINNALARAGEIAGVGRSYVCPLDASGMIDTSHEWAAPGVPKMWSASQQMPLSLLDPWIERLSAGEAVVIERADMLPLDLPTRAVLQRQGAVSLLLAPMRRQGKFAGFVGFTSTLRAQQFSPYEISLLQSVANAIGVVLHRIDAQQEARGAQASLSAKSDHLRAMLTAVPDLVLELDETGRCIAFSLGDGQAMLLPQPDPMGHLIDDLIPPHLVDTFRTAMHEVQADGMRRSFDCEHDVKGEAQVCSASIALRNGNGQKQGWFVVLRDITARRAQQRQIAQLSKIAELTSNLVIVTDANANIEWVNPAFERRSGWRLEEIRGRKPESFLRSRRASRAAAARVSYAIRHGAMMQTEMLNHDRSGKEFWVTLDIQPMLDDSGAVQGFVAVQTDITELKRQHRREMRDWKLAIESAHDGIAMVNSEGYFQFMNHAYREMLGISSTQKISPLHWRDIYPHEPEDWIKRREMRMAGKDRAVQFELRGQHRDGPEIRQEVSLTARADGGLLVIARDISERIRAFAEKARLRDQLQVAQQREVISHVAAGVAHDLNNIFAVISGTAALLEMNCRHESDAMMGLHRIKRAAQMAIDLGAGLATLGRGNAKPIEQDLRALVRQGLDLLGTTRIEQNHVTLTVPDTAQMVWADSTKLLQVVVNLALNACQADQDQSGPVRVEVLPAANWNPNRQPDIGHFFTNRNYSVFQVQDHGLGISPEDRPKLFEPYFTTKGENGTGLGLPIVASILRQSDGAIWFDSTIGQGTTVTVAWPATATDVSLPATPTAQLQQNEAGKAASGLTGLNILVVDDVADVADVLAEMLEAAGAVTVALSDPKEAQAMLTENPGLWSALVTDLDMPDISGVQLAQAASKQTPPVPCILVSGRIGSRVLPQDLFSAILAKPTEASTLINAVQTAVSAPKTEVVS